MGNSSRTKLPQAGSGTCRASQGDAAQTANSHKRGAGVSLPKPARRPAKYVITSSQVADFSLLRTIDFESQSTGRVRGTRHGMGEDAHSLAGKALNCAKVCHALIISTSAWTRPGLTM